MNKLNVNKLKGEFISEKLLHLLNVYQILMT